MIRERYLIKSSGDNVEGTRAGVTQLIQLMSRYNDAVIIVPTIKDVGGSLLETVLDELAPGLANTLFKKREIFLGEGKRVRLCSENTLKDFRRAEVYLALWGSKYTIQDVENLDRWQAVILVSWLAEDYEAWVSHNAVSVIFDDGGRST